MHDKPNVLPKSLSTPTSAPESWTSDDDKPDNKSDVKTKVLSSPSTAFSGLSDTEIYALYSDSRRGQPARNKHFQDYLAATAIISGASQTANPMCLIAQGTGSNGARLGLQVRIKSVNFRIEVKWDQVFNSPGANVDLSGSLYPVRLVIFSDRMPGIGLPNWATNTSPAADVSSLVNTLGAGSAVNMVAPWNINTHGVRYKIYHDRLIYPKNNVFVFNGTAVGPVATNCHEYHATHLNHMVSWYDTNNNHWIDGPLHFAIVTEFLDATWQAPSAPIYVASWDIEFDDVTVG